MSTPCKSKALSLQFSASLSTISYIDSPKVSHIDHLIPDDILRPDTSLDLFGVPNTLTYSTLYRGVGEAVIIETVDTNDGLKM